MIDPDISTADALRLLTARDNIDAAGMDRRRFLQMMGWGVGAGALFGGLGEVLAADLLPGRLREAWATTPVGPNEGILVLIGQFGGSDSRRACPQGSQHEGKFQSELLVHRIDL